MSLRLSAVFLIPLCVPLAAADEAACREAARKGLEMVTAAASRWQQNKTCFSCHHQPLPILAVTEAAKAGFPPGQAWIDSQAETTHRYFEDRTDTMLDGDHVPGGATTVGYGFWALSMASRKPDDTTAAMVAYLLQVQGMGRLNGREPSDLSKVQDGRWITSCRRPPMQDSDVADTVMSLLGMKRFATDDQRDAHARSRAAAEKWLSQAPLVTQEDRIWRLWGLHQLGGDTNEMESVRRVILALQGDDGGWAASEGLESEAFSTGQTLFVLCESGTAPDDPAVLNARDYLVRTQLPDGSWLVKSRLEKKAQPYFENGDPHGEHQFLSTAATSWATAALARLLPRRSSP